MKEIVTTGEICVDDAYGFTYHVAKIEYTEREDESYRYVFTPDYSVMDLLSTEIFQGIPGLDMDQRKECYIRDNMVPVFISERSPGENRENLWELLEECGMAYLNRLEWLIRTDTRYSGDALYVRPWKEKEILEIEHVGELGNRSAVICQKLLKVLCSGGTVRTRDFVMNDENRREFYMLLKTLYLKEKSFVDSQRTKGIRKSAGEGNYRGREKIKLDDIKLFEIISDYEAHRLTGTQAAEKLGISRATFDRRYKEYRLCHKK